MDILTAAKRIKQKDLSPVDLVKQSLAKISEENAQINAFITVAEEEVLQEAKQQEQEALTGKIRSDLHGMPIAAKDLIFTKNLRTTMGSKVYENFVPDADATVIQKL